MTMQYSKRSVLRQAMIALAVFASLFTLPASSPAQDYAAIIAAPDRADGDRQTDQRRDPVKLMAVTGVRSGMNVLDMGTGGGYSTELMARSVLRKAPDGNGYELTCAPENEATIYAQALTLDLWPKASEFGGPVKLVGCDPNFKGAPATGPANQALGLPAELS